MDKLKSLSKEQLTKLLTLLLVVFIAVFSIITITDSFKGNNTIVSDDTTEATLCKILSEIDGVGQVSTMIEYDEDNNVVGVIVTAEGAGSAVIKQQLIEGVSSLFNISSSNVTVFEKDREVNNQND